ncbi:MAG: type II secretion system F family protein [Planctomycetota bacterium]
MARGLTLDEFTAINEELSALTRLGVPLDSGLAGLSRDLPGRLGEAAGEIARRLGEGESLERILESPAFGLPPAYRAVIVAGSRSGQLTRALEETASAARRSANARRSFFLALIYPLFALSIAYAGLLVSLVWTTPKILEAMEGFQGAIPGVWKWLTPLSDSVAWWAPWPPVIVAAGLVWCGRRPWTHASRSPFWSSGSESARMATFLDLLGLMIDNHVTLPEALVLAADASGVGNWQAGARTTAARLNQGERLTRDLILSNGLPAGLGWLSAGGASPEHWAEWLRNAADGYRRRADRRQAQFEQRWPIVLALGLGGAVVLPFTLVLILPWLDFVYGLF